MRHPLHYEHLGHWLLWILAALLAICLLLTANDQSHGQDYWSSVPATKPLWNQGPPPAEYMSFDLLPRLQSLRERSSDRISAPLRIQSPVATTPMVRDPLPGFFGGLNLSLQTAHDDRLQFVRLGRWHQLAELQLLIARSERLLIDVLAREADRERVGGDLTNLLLRQWHEEGAQSRINWEQRCPEQAAWVRDHERWYGPDSIDALATRLLAVTDCPPGS